MRRRLTLAATAAALTAASLVVPTNATAAPPRGVNGSTSGGDRYFPTAGNSGYQVEHYDLRLKYRPTTKALDATAHLHAVATKDLRSFSLDLRDLDVEAVTVNDRPARFRQDDGELIVKPARTLRKKRDFAVRVDYGGTTGQPKDNTGALYGWVSFPDGAFVANEPEGASTWYPVNDVPYDKATYDFTVTVPKGTVAVGNGELLGSRTRKGWTTWKWSAKERMASYLSMAATGNYTLSTSKGPGGVKIINAVDEDLTLIRRPPRTRGWGCSRR